MSTQTCGSTIPTGRPRRTYGKGRICAHDGCDTRVSIYNPSGYCSLHESLHAEDFTVDDVLFKTKTCPVCGKDKLASTDFFHVDSNTADGLSSCCSECRNGWSATYHKNGAAA